MSIFFRGQHSSTRSGPKFIRLFYSIHLFVTNKKMPFLFPRSFSYQYRQLFFLFLNIRFHAILVVFVFQCWNPKLTLYSIDALFNALITHSFSKTLWETKKLLVTSNFFFSHNVFYSINKNVSPFINIYDIISLFVAELEKPKIGMWGEGLSFPVR